MTYRFLCLGAVAALGLFGCDSGPHVVPVTGTVTINGKPLEGATVSFTPEESNAVKTLGTDTTGPEGNFKLMYNDRTGIAPGKYKVLISKQEAKAGVVIPEEFKKDPVMAKMAGMTKESLPPAVSDAEESSFTREVKESGDNVFDFDIKASSKKK